ncbi:hypothetical protein D3C87_2201470 [compost metagenome]
MRYLLARQSLEAKTIPNYTHGIILALGNRDFERAAELTRSYVMEVLPEILRTYREASLQDS